MPRKIARRSVLSSVALVPLTALRSTAQSSVSVFSSAQKRCLEAFANRLVPRDDLGPGAVECGVVEYIERSLADPQIGGKSAMQAGLDAVDAFSRETEGAPLADLSPEKQDAVLTAIEKNSATFFGLIRRLTLEGMFGDPSYGGNRNFAGWDLIRYPGPRLAVAAEDQKMGIEIKPVRYSANGANHGH
ncbi:MAG: gluconate 2-dehydrogenase subunit 3 family protein [Bryobacteraceae bacterium]|jgi:gluconate 2-dehydrogenase gamma chain